MPVRNRKPVKNNTVPQVTEPVPDRILREVTDMYTKPNVQQGLGEYGLQSIAKDLNSSLLVPRKKATVLILGNHSSGKSSFINWYVGENVLATGAAVESRGFTIVTSGDKSCPPIKGEGTLSYLPQLKGITKFGVGLMDNLETVVSVSQDHSFNSVDLIDTPGLVDGYMEYPFDVNNVLLYLADYADLILVFLDPHEQALGSRTMEVVEMLNKNHSNKMRYYLTKIDTVESLQDIMKVSQQLTQNLAPRVKNTHGWEVPTIYLPKRPNMTEQEEDSPLKDLNRINYLCDDIDRIVKQKVQDNLEHLQEDTESLIKRCDRKVSKINKCQSCYSFVRTFYYIFLILFICVFLLWSYHSIYENFYQVESYFTLLSSVVDFIKNGGFTHWCNNVVNCIYDNYPSYIQQYIPLDKCTILTLLVIVIINKLLLKFFAYNGDFERKELFVEHNNNLNLMLKKREELFNKFLSSSIKKTH